MTAVVDGTVAAACHPFFLDSDGGRLFAVHHRPVPGVPPRGQVLCALPFNEEMNRCRSMVSIQAQAFARLGYGTLVVDLFGTGDSEGEFRDGRWELWVDNLLTGARWLDDQPGGCRAMWGIRLGAMLAAEAHQRLSRAATPLILWQPVSDGKLHLTQFLRVRIAAQMDQPSLPKETTAGMRERFAAGECVEVAGYEIHPRLAAALDMLQLASLPPAPGSPVLWLENAGGEEGDLTPASRQVVAKWAAGNRAVDTRLFAGPAFWQLHERVVAPAAVAQTADWLGGLAP